MCIRDRPKGEQLYGDDRESLLRGRGEFIPFLEQHTELTKEDEKLLDEIRATESDWYRTAEEAEEKPQAYACLLYTSPTAERSLSRLLGKRNGSIPAASLMNTIPKSAAICTTSASSTDRQFRGRSTECNDGKSDHDGRDAETLGYRGGTVC